METDAEFDFLVTRAQFHQRSAPEIHSEKSGPSRKVVNYLTKFVSCSRHKNCETPDRSCETCVVLPSQDRLPNGKLPTTEQVLGYLYYQNEQNRQMGVLGASCVREVAGDLLCHWINCNIYTKTLKAVMEDIEALDKKFKTLKRYPKTKKTESSKFEKDLKIFKSTCRGLFDIRTKDSERQKHLGKWYNVTETKEEEEFYAGQCKVPQVRICDNVSSILLTRGSLLRQLSSNITVYNDSGTFQICPFLKRSPFIPGGSLHNYSRSSMATDN